MKFLTAIAAAALVAIGASAQAYTIDSGAIDVGGLDTLLGQVGNVKSADGKNNEEKEAAWASSVLGFDVTFDSKNDSVADDMVQVDGESSLFALDFGSGDDIFYYLFKTGNGSADGSRVFLFGNEIGMDWAVIDLQEMGFGSRITASKLSHMTVLDGGAAETVSVPEPAAVVLFAIGLLGLVVARRRQQ